MRIFLILALLLLTTPAKADGLTLGWPVACTQGDDCWVVHYTDQDPTTGVKDFSCGTLTYDGHTGTDIAIRDRTVMQNGVDVLAALDGRVVRARNDMDDHAGADADLLSVRRVKKEAGNVVSILHDHNRVTEYGHMKKGSVTVKVGQQVLKGDKIGQVGQSGLTEFPHLHFSIYENNKLLDPFTGLAAGNCHASGRQMWDSPLPYDPVKIYAAGFSGAPVDYNKLLVNAASPASLPSNSAALVFWALFFGVKVGDEIMLDVRAPDGSVFATSSETREKDKISYVRFAGLKNSGKPFATGTYTATVTLKRDDRIRTKQSSVMVK